MSNGVKQGGCLFPSLFSIYLNNLITNLRNINIGCKYYLDLPRYYLDLWMYMCSQVIISLVINKQSIIQYYNCYNLSWSLIQYHYQHCSYCIIIRIAQVI